MSKLSDQVLETSEVGCCVTRMGACHCHDHIDEAGRVIAGKLRAILREAARGNAGPNLMALIAQLENAQ